MDFTDLHKRISRPNETYTLQKKIEVIPVKNITKTTLKKDAVGNIIRDTSNIKDEIGNPKTKWEDVQLLQGVIQQQQDLEINTAGSQSKLQYVGYFVPNFKINTNKFENYRVIVKNDYETLVLRISEFNPNLYYQHNRHHYKIGFIEDKKYD